MSSRIMVMKEKLINIPIFDARVIIFYGEHVDVEEGINLKYIDSNFTNTLFHKGQYFCINTDEEINMCIVLYTESTDEHIYHESLHASYDILDHLGIDISAGNNEMLAFLTGYIAKEVIKNLLRWKTTKQIS